MVILKVKTFKNIDVLYFSYFSPPILKWDLIMFSQKVKNSMTHIIIVATTEIFLTLNLNIKLNILINTRSK